LATANTSPVRRFALRWSHAIVWLLLAAAVFVADFGVMGGALAQPLAHPLGRPAGAAVVDGEIHHRRDKEVYEVVFFEDVDEWAR
jgi:hypothetical protein